jgi:hypothetical protein
MNLTDENIRLVFSKTKDILDNNYVLIESDIKILMKIISKLLTDSANLRAENAELRGLLSTAALYMDKLTFGVQTLSVMNQCEALLGDIKRVLESEK